MFLCRDWGFFFFFVWLWCLFADDKMSEVMKTFYVDLKFFLWLCGLFVDLNKMGDIMKFYCKDMKLCFGRREVGDGR